jgi:HD-GYP domain-containing protein (c-di-GMP phosphodiesterase class II)
MGDAVLERMSLVAALQAGRKIARDAIVGCAPEELRNSVYARVFADCFIDRLSEAVCAGDAEALVRWIETEYEARASLPARSLISGAASAVCETFPAASDARAWLAPIASRSEALGRSKDDAASGSAAIDETDVLLSSLLGELSAIDPATAEHSRAVSAWCGRIAEKLRLTPAEIRNVIRGALVLDVGKIATPREILCAERSLLDDEWDVIREHVLTGEKMVAGTSQLRALAPIVRSHHERYDGLGYPDGLSRERIPLAARIVAAADAFNAMIGCRPYRAAMSPQEAADELKRCKGTQFDPNVTDALIEVAGL